MSLDGKVVVITGGTRGIGLEITRKVAQSEAKVVLLGSALKSFDNFISDNKFDDFDIHFVSCDIKEESSIKECVKKIYNDFKSIDAIIHNAAVINLSPSLDVTTDQFNLMYQVNALSVWHLVKHSFEYLNESSIKQVIGVCPPINLDPNWLGAHLPYTATRYLCGMLFSGMSSENPSLRINTLWPKTTIDAPDTCNVISGTYEDTSGKHRSASILADACEVLLSKNAFGQTGENFIDEEVLRSSGIDEFSRYELKKAEQDEAPKAKNVQPVPELELEDNFNK